MAGLLVDLIARLFALRYALFGSTWGKSPNFRGEINRRQLAVKEKLRVLCAHCSVDVDSSRAQVGRVKIPAHRKALP